MMTGKACYNFKLKLGGLRCCPETDLAEILRTICQGKKRQNTQKMGEQEDRKQLAPRALPPKNYEKHPHSSVAAKEP